MALNESMQPITERVVIDIRVCTVFCAFIYNQQRCRFMCSKTTAICLMSNAAVVFSNCGYYIYQIIKWNIETTVCQRSPYLHAHQLSQMTLLLICFIKARLLHHFHTCIVKLVYNPSYLHFLYLDGRSIVLKCSNFLFQTIATSFVWVFILVQDIGSINLLWRLNLHVWPWLVSAFSPLTHLKCILLNLFYLGSTKFIKIKNIGKLIIAETKPDQCDRQKDIHSSSDQRLLPSQVQTATISGHRRMDG